MTRPQTFVEHDILQLDSERGIRYQNFEDFWERRMEPMQFIPQEAKGVFAALRQTLKDRAQEQWELFSAHQNPDGCEVLPQAGQGDHLIDNATSFDVYPEEPSYG